MLKHYSKTHAEAQASPAQLRFDDFVAILLKIVISVHFLWSFARHDLQGQPGLVWLAEWGTGIIWFTTAAASAAWVLREVRQQRQSTQMTTPDRPGEPRRRRPRGLRRRRLDQGVVRTEGQSETGESGRTWAQRTERSDESDIKP